MDDDEIRYRNHGAVRTRMNSAVVAGIALVCVIVAFAALATLMQNPPQTTENPPATTGTAPSNR